MFAVMELSLVVAVIVQMMPKVLTGTDKVDMLSIGTKTGMLSCYPKFIKKCWR